MGRGTDIVRIGRFGRPHGVHGAVRVTSFSGEVEHFRALAGTEITCVRDEVQREIVVEAVSVHHRTPVLTIRGIDTPEAARALSGFEIAVSRADAAPLNTDEYYVSDLVGCNVMVSGNVVGSIVGVADGLQAPLLEVKRVGESGPPSMVPFMAVYIGEVDLDAHTMVLEEPWILDSK